MFKKSLRKKLFISFLIIGFIPFFILLLYTMSFTESKLLKQTIDEQFNQMQITIKLMNNHLYTLKKDVKFLSSLDVMDDILADDIDKRISRLLAKKAVDIDKNTKFILINNEQTIIASSNAAAILQEFHLNKELIHKGHFIKNKKLYIYSTIVASFDKNKKIGILILEYNLKNLAIFLSQKSTIHSYILNAQDNRSIGTSLDFSLNFQKHLNNKITDKYVIVYKKINFFQGEWYLVYAVNKAVALASLYDFVKFMIYISIIIFLFVLYVSFKYSKEIIKPIEDLTYITNEITDTHNYTKQLTCSSNDEIQTLTNAFNIMLETTSTALLKLEDENRRRLAQFVHLINVFNRIIQTKDENECIGSSIDEIRLLTNKNDLHFQYEKPPIQNEMSIDLYVTNFQTHNKVYYGTILLGFENYYDENEKKLYNSIATMITLQLDRIRLIENTMSVSKAKSAFISNMSHELRTPLNAIISSTQLMIAYEKLTDEQQDTIANIESSAHYLLDMINGILDIAKIEAGKVEIHPEKINLIKLIQNSSDILMPLLSDKNLQFIFNTENLDKTEQITDSKIMQQIIINLMSNAVKFTNKGKITLDLYDDDKYIYLKITDTGIGISEEKLSLLFKDFTQIENMMQKKYKGTGLGLSLSKKMAYLIGGDVNIKSNGLRKGTTVTLLLKKEWRGGWGSNPRPSA